MQEQVHSHAEVSGAHCAHELNPLTPCSLIYILLMLHRSSTKNYYVYWFIIYISLLNYVCSMYLWMVPVSLYWIKRSRCLEFL